MAVHKWQWTKYGEKMAEVAFGKMFLQIADCCSCRLLYAPCSFFSTEITMYVQVIS